MKFRQTVLALDLGLETGVEAVVLAGGACEWLLGDAAFLRRKISEHARALLLLVAALRLVHLHLTLLRLLPFEYVTETVGGTVLRLAGEDVVAALKTVVANTAGAVVLFHLFVCVRHREAPE